MEKSPENKSGLTLEEYLKENPQLSEEQKALLLAAYKPGKKVQIDSAGNIHPGEAALVEEKGIDILKKTPDEVIKKAKRDLLILQRKKRR